MYKFKKANLVIVENLNEQGRFISQKEFNWIMGRFRDRYDPRRLCLALMYTTGLRLHDGINARLKWFSDDFRYMKMSQCKGKTIKKKRNREEYSSISFKPRFVPLPKWLRIDLHYYIKYRLALGIYAKGDLESLKLFPSLKKTHIFNFFAKTRKKFGEKEPWLLDLYQTRKGFDEEGNPLWSQKQYRVSSHACRVNYVTSAYEVTNKDIVATQLLSGHSKLKDVQRYVRTMGLSDKKMEIINRFMNPLVPEQKIPIVPSQKKIHDF